MSRLPSARAISPTTGWMHEKEFILELIPTDDHSAGSCFITAKLLQQRKTLKVEYYLRIHERAALEKGPWKDFYEFVTIVPFLSHRVMNNID